MTLVARLWTGFVKALQPINQLQNVGRSAWSSLFRVLETFAGAWQQNVEVTLTDVLTHPVVYACISLIASDIGKMGGARLVARDDDGIWNEIDTPAFSPVLRKPNKFQTRIQFNESWMFSKLSWGNAYILKLRDSRRLVTAMYVLDPQRVTPLVAPNGDVYYELLRDDIAGQPENSVVVPASEIIHDRMNCFYHPLVGLPPIHACGLAAVMGLKIINNSATLFANGSRPGGVLTVPGDITIEQAQRMKEVWEANQTGENLGKIAVVGNGLTYTPMAQNARDSQLVEQGDWVSKLICTAFGVPAYMVGVGAIPMSNNVAALKQQYYDQCLMRHVEAIELLLDEGLGLTDGKYDGLEYGTEFDTKKLLRMDDAALMKTLADGVQSALIKPDEGRLELNRPPVEGGDALYLQQQNYSLAALAKRDAKADPFTSTTPPAQPQASSDDELNDDEGDETDDMDVRSLGAELARKSLALAEELAVTRAA
jgi:HK97 family phage portal protein